MPPTQHKASGYKAGACRIYARNPPGEGRTGNRAPQQRLRSARRDGRAELRRRGQSEERCPSEACGFGERPPLPPPTAETPVCQHSRKEAQDTLFSVNRGESA